MATMSISALHDQATADVNGLAYMHAFIEQQMTPFERELMESFLEESIEDTLNSLQYFMDQPSDYDPGDVKGLVSERESELWDTVSEGGAQERRNALGAILWHCEHMWIHGPYSFRKALVHTARVYKAPEMHDALTRYQVEKIEQRFAELAEGSDDADND